MAAASRKRALIPYFFSASTKAAPSLGSGVAAFRYSSIAQADTPLIDRRFVSRVMGRPVWYGLARGTRASAEGMTTLTMSMAVSTASVTRRRGREVIGSRRAAERDVEPRCVSASAPATQMAINATLGGERVQPPSGVFIGQVARLTHPAASIGLPGRRNRCVRTRRSGPTSSPSGTTMARALRWWIPMSLFGAVRLMVVAGATPTRSPGGSGSLPPTREGAWSAWRPGPADVEEIGSAARLRLVGDEDPSAGISVVMTVVSPVIRRAGQTQ